MKRKGPCFVKYMAGVYVMQPVSPPVFCRFVIHLVYVKLVFKLVSPPPCEEGVPLQYLEMFPATSWLLRIAKILLTVQQALG